MISIGLSHHWVAGRDDLAQTISLSAFIGTARTTLRAGRALIVIGVPVCGF
ncbi:MAG: hypothetical protein WBX00_25225 [Isosphaeraceae bacterium]